MSKTSWLVRAAALGIFLLGFAAGALAPSVYRAWGGGGRVGREDRLERMSKRLNLSPEQKTQVQQIFGETRTQLESLREETAPRFAEIRRQADGRIEKVLTPEQWQQFQQSRRDERPRGRRGRGGRDDGARP
ncbi:MAG TPA: periplasmic heavy metal sensor [Pyrinomonadaceae bacterium]